MSILSTASWSAHLTHRRTKKSTLKPSSQEDGLGFPQVRIVLTTSLATGCILNYNTGAVEGKTTGEVLLFRENKRHFLERPYCRRR